MTENTNNVMVVRLDPDSLDDLAHRIAELVGRDLQPPASRPRTAEEGRLLTAAQVAERWGVDRSWVYDHAEQLGARRLGTGKRPRLRFDPAEAAAYLQPADPTTRAAAPGVNPRRSRGLPSDCAEGLPFRGRPELSSATQRSRRPGGAVTPPATAPKPRTSTR